MHFLADFSQNLTNHTVIFCAFGRKTEFIANFAKTVENFENVSYEN